MVRPFDRNLQSVIVSDSSRLFGYGWMLLQYPKGTNVTRLPDPSLPGKSKKSKDTPRPHLICCGSKTLSKSARNYSALELEANAIHAAVTRACDSDGSASSWERLLHCSGTLFRGSNLEKCKNKNHHQDHENHLRRHFRVSRKPLGTISWGNLISFSN